jgi:hypothetical protein
VNDSYERVNTCGTLFFLPATDDKTELGLQTCGGHNILVLSQETSLFFVSVKYKDVQKENLNKMMEVFT